MQLMSKSLMASLPRRRRATVKDHYRQLYSEVLDLAVSTITSGFDQPGYAAYRRAEDLLIKSVSGEDASSELDSVVTF